MLVTLLYKNNFVQVEMSLITLSIIRIKREPLISVGTGEHSDNAVSKYLILIRSNLI